MLTISACRILRSIMQCRVAGCRVLGAALLLAVPGIALPETAMHEYYLDNGLKLVVKQDCRAPVVATQVWYRVGGSYEPNGLTGISHALEHMMFKGTEAYPGNEFSRLISLNGGNDNAFTSSDYTAYHQQLANDRLELSFRLEADRMRGLVLDANEFEREIEVIKEERRWRVDDDPNSYTYEAALATTYQVNAYRNPVIGWMADLENMAIDDLRQWYRRWYTPSNATVVVVGDVEPEQVRALAESHFGPVPSDQSAPKPWLSSEPPQLGVRRLTLKLPAKLPYLVMTFKVPSLVSAHIHKEVPEWQPYALMVLAELLGGGESSRLQDRLVRGAQLAASVYVGYNSLARLQTSLVFAATPAHGRSNAELETALLNETRILHDELVDKAELEKIKTQLIADEIYERDSVYVQALLIGQTDSVGLPLTVLDEFISRVKTVTTEQVREVARTYLQQDQLTVAVLDPQPLPPARQPKPPRPAGRVH